MSFQEISKAYHLLTSKERLKKEVPQLVSWLGEAQRIVDLGCGLGEHAAILTQHYPYNVHAIDADPGMVEEGRCQHPDLSFSVGDLSSPPLKAWDAILCLGNSIACLNSETDWTELFMNWKKASASNGKCLIQLATPPEEDHAQTIVRQDSSIKLTKTLTRTHRTSYELRVEVEDQHSKSAPQVHFQTLQVIDPNVLTSAMVDAGWSQVCHKPPYPGTNVLHNIIEAYLKGDP